jgi:FixJ family two-component response regulator
MIRRSTLDMGTVGTTRATTKAEVVYLIDDDAGVRESIAGFLFAARIDVVCFESAADYLQHEKSDGAACLILDLQLPMITGLDLQRRLSEEWAPPIIFISGRGDIPSTVQAMKAGAIEFLTKPVNPEMLLPTIASAFARDRENREKRAEMTGLRKRWEQLSPRERDVLPLVVKGLLNKQSAAALGITEVTLQIHRSNIMKKMAADSFADLVRMAEKLGASIRTS